MMGFKDLLKKIGVKRKEEISKPLAPPIYKRPINYQSVTHNLIKGEEKVSEAMKITHRRKVAGVLSTEWDYVLADSNFNAFKGKIGEAINKFEDAKVFTPKLKELEKRVKTVLVEEWSRRANGVSVYQVEYLTSEERSILLSRDGNNNYTALIEEMITLMNYFREKKTWRKEKGELVFTPQKDVSVPNEKVSGLISIYLTEVEGLFEAKKRLKVSDS